MKKTTFLYIVITLLLATSCQNKKELKAASIVEAYSDSLFKASIDSAQIAGGSILVFQKGKTLLKKSFGFASLELSTAMPDNAIFDIGSVTKQFTAPAILKLDEKTEFILTYSWPIANHRTITDL